MLLRFTKMHGLGNDFVLLDQISQNVHLRAEQICALGDRRLGIGFDQLLMVEPPRDPALDFRYRIFNADGTEAEQCGNGARCFVRFVRDRGLTTKSEVRLETNTGIISCRLERDGRVTVNMGAPHVAPELIPFVAESPAIVYDLELPATAHAAGCHGSVQVSAVSIGNPHAVLLVDDVDTAPVNTLGPVIEAHPRFPNKVNVGFMQVVDKHHVRLRVFERGVGETRACGTGACAAVVAGRLRGLLADDVTVSLTGGDLQIHWAGDDAPIEQTGPVCRVFEGRLHI